MIYAIETVNQSDLRLAKCFEGPPDALRWAADAFGLTVGDLDGMQSALQFDDGYVHFGPRDGYSVTLLDVNPQGDGIDQKVQIEQASRHLLGYSGIPSQQAQRVHSVAMLLEPVPFGTEDEYAAAELISRSDLIDGLTAAGWSSFADDVRTSRAPVPVLYGRAYVNEATGAIAVFGAHMIRAEAALTERREEEMCEDDEPGAYQVLLVDPATGDHFAVIVNADDRSAAFAGGRAALRARGCSEPRQLSASLIGDGAQTFLLSAIHGDAQHVTAEQLAAHGDTHY